MNRILVASIFFIAIILLVDAGSPHLTASQPVAIPIAQPVKAVMVASTQPLTETTRSLYLPTLLRDFDPATYTPPEPTDAVILAQFPRVARSQSRREDGTVAVGYEIYNNTGSPLTQLELDLTVLTAQGVVTGTGATSSPSTLFNSTQTPANSAATELICSFQLADGAQLPARATAQLTCQYTESQVGSSILSEIIRPEPFSSDQNYNQLHDLLEAQLAALQPNQRAESRITVLVMFSRPLSGADRERFAAAGGVLEQELPLIDGFVGNLPAANVQSYRTLAAAGRGLDMIQPQLSAQPEVDTATANTRARQVWTGALQGIDAQTHAELAFTGDPKTAIAIVDTGIDGTHPALSPFRNFAPADWNNAALVAANKVVGWQDFDPVGANSPLDRNGHGSNVAGIAAGTGSGVTGGLDLRGVAYTAKLVGVRFPQGRFNSDGYVRALTWVVTNRQRYHIVAVNQSYGTRQGDPAWQRASQRVVESGVVLVSSAGNYFDETRDGVPINGPAIMPKVLTVGAVNDLDQIAWFSSNGDDTLYRHTKPDVVAPGGTSVINNVFVWSSQMNGPDTNSGEEFVDNNGDGVHQAGDPCFDANGNGRWDRHLDLYLDLNQDLAYQAGEPILDGNGVPGFQPGGDFCWDRHLPAGSAFSGELFFDRNTNLIWDAQGGQTPAANDYATMSGTSQAAPVVSGEVALIVDAMTDYAAADSDGQGGADEDLWNGIDDDQDDIIDEDQGEWNYDQRSALLVKSLVLMNSYEVSQGEIVPQNWLYFDENGDGVPTLRAGAPLAPVDEVIRSGNNDYIFRLGDGDVIFSTGRNGVADTRNGHDFSPGDGDLFRNPWFNNAGSSNAPGDDGSNGGTANDGRTDHYDRGEKDVKEGYGRIAMDAAIESVAKEFCAVETDAFGAGLTDKKVWARHLHLYAGKEYKAILDGPGGADYDLYLYREGYGSLPNNGLRTATGDPQLAVQAGNPKAQIKSARPNTADEEITFQVAQDGLYFLVVRRVSGAGEFTVRLITPEEWSILLYMSAEQAGAANLDALLDKAINDLEATGSGEESMQRFQVIALADYDDAAWDGKDGSGGQPDHRGDAVVYCIRKDHKDDTHQYSIPLQPTEVLSVTVNAGDRRTEANLGDPATLDKAFAWMADYFPAQKYGVILWGDGRGYGWKVNPDLALGPGNDTQSTVGGGVQHDALEMHELAASMAAVKAKMAQGSQYKQKTGVPKNLDLLGFDLGHMALIEVGQQVQESVEVMAASEERIHEDGWPYKEFLQKLTCSREVDNSFDCDAVAKVDAEALGAHAVGIYHTYYTTDVADDKHTLSAIRLNPKPQHTNRPNACDTFAGLVGCVSAFGAELKAGVADIQKLNDPDDNVQIRIKVSGREAGGIEEMEDHNYIDLRHFARLVRDAGDIPAQYKSQSNPIFLGLEIGAGVIISSAHGSVHPNVHGLTIYYPRDQFKPMDANCKDAPDAGDRTCGFDNPLPSQVLYAKDPTILVPKLRRPISDTVHPRPQIPELRFPEETNWDEFLHRYYKPVADACVLYQGACTKSVVIHVNDEVTLSALGSSDSDGPIDDNIPEAWYWDGDPTQDTAGLLPVYPITPTGVIDDPCTEDCDRDEVDGPDDDPDFSGRTVKWKCEQPGQYQFRLMTHDEHNNQAGERGEHPHFIHWKLDTDSVSVSCAATPTKRSAPATVRPGEKIHYTLSLPTHAQAEGPVSAWIEDPLPDLVQMESSTLICSTGICSYDPETHVVNWAGTLQPGGSVEMDFDVRVPVEVPLDWPDIVNQARTYDGATIATVAATTKLLCVPQKRSHPPLVEPGSTIAYQIILPASPELTGPAEGSIVDTLPPILQFNGQMTCSHPGCAYDPSTRQISWNGTLQPGDQVVIDFHTAVTPVPTCPPQIINETTVNDGVTVQTVGASTTLVCAQPSGK